MSKKWNAEKTIAFLEGYEQFPCLWDVHLQSYKNKEARETAYERIATSMNLENFGMNEVKAKIRSIRNAYTLELTKIAKSKKSGSSADDIYKPKVRWFTTADRILNRVVQIRESHATEIHSQSQETQDIQESQDIEKSQELQETPESLISEEYRGDVFERDVMSAASSKEPQQNAVKVKNTAPTKFKKTKISPTEQAIAELKVLSQTLNQPLPQESEFDLFGKTVACQLRKLPEAAALESMAFIHSHLVQQRLNFSVPNHSYNSQSAFSSSPSSSSTSFPTSNGNQHSLGTDSNILSQAVSSLLNDDL